MSEDILEKLTAANPLRDGDRLTPEEELEAEALLRRLQASPVPPTARRTRLRWAPVAAGVAAVAAAAFVAANLADPDGSGPGVVERAVAAATSEDAVYHLVERTSWRSSSGEAATTYLESWHTTDGRVHQRRFEYRAGERGPLLSDFAGRRGGSGLAWTRGNRITLVRFGWRPGPVPQLDPAGDPGAQLQALEEQGRLKAAGTEMVGSRRAHRLESGPIAGPAGAEQRIVFLVDAETYLPVEVHHTLEAPTGETTSIDTRYLVYERSPLNAQTSELLALDPHPDARCEPGTEDARGLGFPNPCASP